MPYPSNYDYGYQPYLEENEGTVSWAYPEEGDWIVGMYSVLTVDYDLEIQVTGCDPKW